VGLGKGAWRKRRYGVHSGLNGRVKQQKKSRKLTAEKLRKEEITQGGEF